MLSFSASSEIEIPMQSFSFPSNLQRFSSRRSELLELAATKVGSAAITVACALKRPPLCMILKQVTSGICLY